MFEVCSICSFNSNTAVRLDGYNLKIYMLQWYVSVIHEAHCPGVYQMRISLVDVDQ